MIQGTVKIRDDGHEEWHGAWTLNRDGGDDLPIAETLNVLELLLVG